MKIINAGYEIITPINDKVILECIEKIARTCYKSESRISDDSAERFVGNLIKNGHHAMLEHCSFSVKLIVDRGVTHELVRHRLASFAQESTRYCNYSQDSFGGEITFIKPCYYSEDSMEYGIWKAACLHAENFYFGLLEIGSTPQEARSVLPNSVKSEICVTANLREWRHILNLRAAGATGKPHPQMLEVMVPLLHELQERIPVIFDDIKAVP